MNPVKILLAALPLLAASGAWAASPDTGAPAAVVMAPASADLRYATGAYFYGADCGGNAAMTSRTAPTKASSGVILSGGAGTGIAGILNCGDRRYALASYRDAFEGTIGQSYVWLDPDNAATGSVTGLGRYRDAGLVCVKFRAVTTVSRSLASNTGTACRMNDGNWHTP